MKKIQFDTTPKPLEHVPDKVKAINNAHERLPRILPNEFFYCAPLSQRMTRVACAKSWQASPRLKTVKGKLSQWTGKVSAPSVSMRPANACSSCPIGRNHNDRKVGMPSHIPSAAPTCAPVVIHASAGTSTSTATMRRDLGITANRVDGRRGRP